MLNCMLRNAFALSILPVAPGMAPPGPGHAHNQTCGYIKNIYTIYIMYTGPHIYGQVRTAPV